MWYLKCRALTLKGWVDDTEIEEEGVADILLDENQVAQVPRPGTSLARPLTSAAGSVSGRPRHAGMRHAGGFGCQIGMHHAGRHASRRHASCMHTSSSYFLR